MDTIKGNTPMTLNLMAGQVKFLIEVVESLALPRKDTDAIYESLTQQYEKQFKKTLKAV